MSRAGVLLRPKPGGGVRVLARPEDVPPDQLALLRLHRDEVEQLVAAYGEVELHIRPVTPVPPPEPSPPPFFEPRRRGMRRAAGGPWP